MLEVILSMCLSMLGGAVFGLIPFFLGNQMGKPGLARLGWKWTMVSGLLFLQVPVAVGFVVAIIVRQSDYYPSQRVAPAAVSGTAAAGTAVKLGLTCLAGPLKGRTYLIGENGIVLGRGNDCAICFGPNAPGISQHHCSLRWQQGVLMLTDLNSSFGTYLADGRKLPPQYPVQVAVGSRFYLSDHRNLFQIVIAA